MQTISADIRFTTLIYDTRVFKWVLLIYCSLSWQLNILIHSVPSILKMCANLNLLAVSGPDFSGAFEKVPKDN